MICRESRVRGQGPCHGSILQIVAETGDIAWAPGQIAQITTRLWNSSGHTDPPSSRMRGIEDPVHGKFPGPCFTRVMFLSPCMEALSAALDYKLVHAPGMRHLTATPRRGPGSICNRERGKRMIDVKIALCLPVSCEPTGGVPGSGGTRLVQGGVCALICRCTGIEHVRIRQIELTGPEG